MKKYFLCLIALAALLAAVGCNAGVLGAGGDVPEGSYPITIMPAAQDILTLNKEYGEPGEQIVVKREVVKDNDGNDIEPMVYYENKDGVKKSIPWLALQQSSQMLFNMPDPGAPVFLSIKGSGDGPDTTTPTPGGPSEITDYLKKATFSDKADSTVWYGETLSHVSESAAEFDVTKANSTIKVDLELEEGSYSVGYRLASSGTLTTVSGNSFEVAGPASGAPVYIEIHVSGTATHIYMYIANYKGEGETDPAPLPEGEKSALLKSLSIPGITFTFSETTYSYDFSSSPVTSGLTSINIIPTAKSATAAITIDSAPVTSGTSYAGSLTNSGTTANAFTINVVDGTESQVYTVKVYRSLSGDAGLTSIGITDRDEFTQNIPTVSNSSYELNTATTPLPYTSETLYFIIKANHSKAVVSVDSNPAVLADGVWSATVALANTLPDYNTITVKVTAEDNSTKNYTFKVYLDYKKSDNANLAAIVTTQNTKSYATADVYPKFDKDVLEYTLYTNDKTKGVVLDAVKQHNLAKLEKNFTTGITFKGTETDWAVYTFDTPYTFKVTAEDGVTVKTYTVSKYVVVPKISGSDKLLQAKGGTMSYVGNDEVHIYHEEEGEDDGTFKKLTGTFELFVGKPELWYLVNGGGGAGGSNKTYASAYKEGGGGGGGGAVAETKTYIPKTMKFDIVVGAGGVGDTDYAGNWGGDSSITDGTSVIKALGGGGGDPGMDRDDDKRKDKGWSANWGYGGNIVNERPMGGAGGQWYTYSGSAEIGHKPSRGGGGGGGASKGGSYGESALAGSANGGIGGDGISSDISGTSREYGAGGAGGHTYSSGSDGGSGGNSNIDMKPPTNYSSSHANYDFTNSNWSGYYGQKKATADAGDSGSRARRGGNGWVVIRFTRVNTDTRPAE